MVLYRVGVKTENILKKNVIVQGSTVVDLSTECLMCDVCGKNPCNEMK